MHAYHAARLTFLFPKKKKKKKSWRTTKLFCLNYRAILLQLQSYSASITELFCLNYTPPGSGLHCVRCGRRLDLREVLLQQISLEDLKVALRAHNADADIVDSQALVALQGLLERLQSVHNELVLRCCKGGTSDFSPHSPSYPWKKRVPLGKVWKCFSRYVFADCDRAPIAIAT